MGAPFLKVSGDAGEQVLGQNYQQNANGDEKEVFNLEFLLLFGKKKLDEVAVTALHSMESIHTPHINNGNENSAKCL